MTVIKDEMYKASSYLLTDLLLWQVDSRVDQFGFKNEHGTGVCVRVCTVKQSSVQI